jgi:hypothetical protein
MRRLLPNNKLAGKQIIINLVFSLLFSKCKKPNEPSSISINKFLITIPYYFSNKNSKELLRNH